MPVPTAQTDAALEAGKPPTKGEAAYDRIVEAAYRLFLEQGYHGTSMRQIADRAGITLGGIYNHFTGKEAIWVAVFTVKHPYHEIVPAIKSAQGETVPEFIRRAAYTLVESLGRREDLLNLMFIELVEFKGIHTSEIYGSLLPDILELGELFASKAGTLRAIPRPILMRSFVGLFFSYYITDILLPPEAREMMGQDALHAFVDIYLHGIMAAPTND